MKVIIIADLRLEGGGPIHRILPMLPYLYKLCNVIFISLGPPDKTFEKVFHELKIKFYPTKYSLREWFVRKLRKTIHNILQIVDKESPDIVVLSWEVWDLMVGLLKPLSKRGIPFAVVLHSIPFVDAPPKPSTNIYTEIIKRILTERNFYVKLYLLVRGPLLSDVIRKINIITINETVDYYLCTYFNNLTPITALPGYAVDLDEILTPEYSNKTYDLIYMARLEYGKGIFELPKIIKEIKKIKRDIKLLILGKFENLSDERKFIKQLNYLNLTSNIRMAGWVEGKEKYLLLKKAKIFLYPSLTSDTFSISLLEALACGLPAICYDTPFIRIIYRTPAVYRVPYKNFKEMALIAKELLSDEEKLVRLSREAIKFSLKYSSWEDVANAEFQAYKIVIRKTLINDSVK